MCVVCLAPSSFAAYGRPAAYELYCSLIHSAWKTMGVQKSVGEVDVTVAGKGSCTVAWEASVGEGVGLGDPDETRLTVCIR